MPSTRLSIVDLGRAVATGRKPFAIGGELDAANDTAETLETSVRDPDSVPLVYKGVDEPDV